MKKLFFLAVAISVSLIGCDGNKSSYKITGTVEGAADGDTVFIQELSGRDLYKVDTAYIKNEKFTFTGKQDSVVDRYITYVSEVNPYLTDFFLENGNISMTLGEVSVVKGTKNNDIYQNFKDKVAKLTDELQAYYASFQNRQLTEEEEEEAMEGLRAKQDAIGETVRSFTKDNVNNPVGIYLVTRYNYLMDFEELDEILAAVPENYRNNEQIKELIDVVETAKKVAVGQKFSDLEMENPEGKLVKLSDYVYNNKYTLVDFWASWCGPCRAEMPEVIELYKKYKSQGLEIVGVSFDRRKEDWINGINELSIPWPQMSDLKLWESEGAKVYSIRSIPHTVLIDQEGTIIAKGLYSKDLKEKFEELFN